MVIWTKFFNPFVMGGSCIDNRGFEKELDVNLQVDLGRGYGGFVLTSPKGKTIVVEKESGSIVGNSLDEVRGDIMIGGSEMMKKQVQKACEESKSVTIMPEKEFWYYYDSK